MTKLEKSIYRKLAKEFDTQAMNCFASATKNVSPISDSFHVTAIVFQNFAADMRKKVKSS